MASSKHRFRKAAWLFVAVLAILVALRGPFIASRPFSGRVVDSVTGNPVEGVIVVAQWNLQAFESSSLDFLTVRETTTDSTGSFTMPGWGPVFNRRFLYTNVRADAPDLIVFRNGYLPVFRRNSNPGWPLWNVLSASQLDGKTIEITPFDGPMDEYIQALRDIDARIRWHLDRDSNCSWKMISGLILEIHKVEVAAKQESGQQYSRMYRGIPKQSCGDPQSYFEDHT